MIPTDVEIRRYVKRRSMALSALLVLVGGVQMVSGIYEEFLSPEAQGAITALVGIAYAWLEIARGTRRGEEEVLKGR